MNDNELEEYFETEKRVVKVLERALARGRPRTIEEFVKEMIAKSRTLSQILIIANCTRWKGNTEKIKELYYARTGRKDEKVLHQAKIQAQRELNES